MKKSYIILRIIASIILIIAAIFFLGNNYKLFKASMWLFVVFTALFIASFILKLVLFYKKRKAIIRRKENKDEDKK